MGIFSRLELLIGKEAVLTLKNKRVVLFGVGGVGGYVFEGLVRSGVGHITIVDNDKFSKSNINRQIGALNSSLDRLKVDVLEERAKDINPLITIEKITEFYPSKTEIDFSLFDYVIDAVDTVSSKLIIIEKAIQANVKIISSMGTGNKTDPSKVKLTDIYKTSTDPLARVMRYELKKRGIKKLKVVYSDEVPVKTENKEIASNIFVPATAGLLIASEAVKDLTKANK